MIRIRDGQFELDGVKRPYYGQTMFKWSSLFYPPHRDLGKARAVLQRAKSLGFDLIRVFDEHHAWVGNEFLSTGLPLNQPWNLAMSPSSSFSLSLEQKQAYRDMAQMLEDEGMFAELVINVTIKQEPGFLQGKHERMVRFWERMQRVVLQELREIGADRMILENCNEYNAHTPSEALSFLRNDSNGVDLLPRMALRATIDYPGRPYGISQGGSWDVDLPDGFTHLNVHSERGERWWDITGHLVDLSVKYPGIPHALNENMHGMSKAQWEYWLAHSPNPAKLRAQSRPDTDENVAYMRRQWNKAELHGWSYTLHNANGIFGDPDLPLDGFERAWAEDHQAEPDEPEPWEVEISSPDAKGRRSIAITLTDWPRLVKGGDEAYVQHEVYHVDLGDTYDVYAMGSFIGLDRGDIGEFDVEVDATGGPQAYQRSLHKEVEGIYDAFHLAYYGAKAREFTIYVSARVTGVNKITPRTNPLSARPHFAVYMYAMEPVQAPSSPSPTPERHVLHWEEIKDQPFRREPYFTTPWVKALIAIDQQLIWDGVRNPQAALNCPLALAEYGLTEAQARANISTCWAALTELRRYALIQAPDTLVSGKFKTGTVYADEWNRLWTQQLAPALSLAEHMNGIRGRAKELCG